MIHNTADLMPIKPAVNDEEQEEEDDDSSQEPFDEIRDLVDMTHIDRTSRSYGEAIAYIAGYITRKVFLVFLQRTIIIYLHCSEDWRKENLRPIAGFI